MMYLPKKETDKKLDNLTAILKAKAGIVLNKYNRYAILLFGRNKFTRTGLKELVKKIYREILKARIPGRNEDVILDLAIRELVKGFRKKISELEKGAAKL
jgi:acyl-CoA dehydrogenase